jgi:hypothetical protein
MGGGNIPLGPSENLEKDKLGNAHLKTSLIIQYYFEREQPLLVNIVKSKEGLPPDNWNIQTTVGCIMGSRKNTLIKPIPQGAGENLIISAEKIQQGEDLLFLHFDVKSNSTVNWDEAKNKFVFKLMSGTNQIYKSECIGNNAKFMSVKIPAGLLTNGMNFTFYDCKNKVVLTENTSIQELINQKQFSLKMSKREHSL